MKKSSRRPREIFLSHAHEDRSIARQLADDLTRHSLRAWISDHHVAAPHEWIDEIGKALKRCDWFIVVLTPAAIRSIWVKREVGFALNDRRYAGRIIPLVARACNPTQLAWPLAVIQSLDCRDYDKGIRKLLRIWNIAYRP